MAEATVKDLKEYFGSDGYPEVENREILEMKRDDPEGYDELKKLVGEHLAENSEDA